MICPSFFFGVRHTIMLNSKIRKTAEILSHAEYIERWDMLWLYVEHPWFDGKILGCNKTQVIFCSYASTMSEALSFALSIFLSFFFIRSASKSSR